MADTEPKVKDVSSSSKEKTPHCLVTEDHVRAALTADKSTDARLTSWKVVDFTKKGDNYVCVVTSVEVEYVLDGQSSQVVYVVKLTARERFGPQDFNDLVFEKEAKFHLNLAPEINAVLKEIGHKEVNFPKCLYASLEKGKEIIFLEDLRTRGYKMFDRKRGMDEAHANLVLKELAKLHAASLLLQNKTPDENIKEKYPYIKQGMYYFLSTSDMFLKIMKDSAKFAQDILNKVGGYERASAWIDTIIPNLVDIFYEQLECGDIKVVCHGDCWNNNLLFRYSEDGHPESVMLLDLQVVNYAPPTTDLNYFLFTSMTGDVRKPNTEAFLGYYYGAFRDIMEDAGQKMPFTQAQLLKDFRTKNALGSIFAMMSVPVMIFEFDDAEDSSKDTDENIEEMMLQVREKSMDMLDTSPILKPRFLAVFDEMMELGIIS